MYKIAIFGKANTGKNTLSKLIYNQLKARENTQNRVFTHATYIAFADPLKEMAEIMFPDLPKKFLYGSSKYRGEVIPGAFKNGQPLTVRGLLIDLGSNLGRGYNSDIWLNNFDYRVNKLSTHSGAVILTDGRFRNEFDHLKSKGYYIIRLLRKAVKSNINHVSETGQDYINDEEFHYVLHNDNSISELKQEVLYKLLPNIK